jgi:hypothetical protein
MDNPINYEQIAQEVRERKEATPELQRAQHQEVISSMLREHRTAVSSSAPDAATAAHTQAMADEQHQHLPSYAGEAPADVKQQAEALVAYTLEHGIRAGVEKAAKGDPFLMDLYHDTLTEKLYEELKNRKLI